MTKRTLLLALLLSILFAGVPGSGSEERALGLLDGLDPRDEGGDLPLEAVCVAAGTTELGQLYCVLQVVVPSASLGGGASRSLRLSVAVADLDEAPAISRRSVDTGPLGHRGSWVYLVPVGITEELRGIAVVVEDPTSGRWGGSLAEVEGEPLPVDEGASVSEGSPIGLRTAPPEAAAGAGARPSSMIRLVPPRQEPATGPTRIEVIATSEAVERVEFFLDGARAGEDRRPPFAARLELAAPARPQEIRAVAYDEFGNEVGRDTLTVNPGAGVFRVTIRSVAGDPASGSVEVTAGVEVPPGSELDRLEFYFNGELAAQRRRPPFTASVPTPTAGPTDFVRVAAILADGSSIDTVRLLAAQGVVEELDVNLVELYVVVSDADGRPVEGLPKEAFSIRRNGRPQAIEGFQFAQDLPLLLGLVIDSSGSMDERMTEAKQAAGGFLGQIMKEGDRTFLVDFDTRPRLAHPVTADLRAIFRTFPSLRPEGATAIYDSVVFSVLHFDQGRGRKALVILTDGDDYQSRYSPRRAIGDARDAGVPVYVIALGEGKQARRILKTSDLDNLTEKTGGRVFLATRPGDLAKAYAQIEAELRSQYLLTFYAEPDGKDLEVEVLVDRPGARARTVIGGR